MSHNNGNRANALYSEAAFLVCIVLGRNCRIKSALYDNQFATDLRRLYALACKTLDSYDLLSRSVKHSNLLSDKTAQHLESRHFSENTVACEQCQLTILAHELLIGARRANHHDAVRELSHLTGNNQAVKSLRRGYRHVKKSKADKLTESLESTTDQANKLPLLPCYARVNGLLSDRDTVLSTLSAQPYEKVEYNPTEASCIPAEVLQPDPSADVLDACAAPGNKTLQLIEMMSNQATVFAVDRDPQRFRKLCDHLTNHGVTRLSMSERVEDMIQQSTPEGSNEEAHQQPRVEAICADFLTLDPRDPRFARIRYILLDPSCSGTGLAKRQPDGSGSAAVPSTIPGFRRVSLESGFEADTDGEENRERLKRLANMQAMLLRHALSFPNVERVVYSTCSVQSEENEAVVQEQLDRMKGTFSVESIWSAKTDPPSSTPNWPTRGLDEMNCEACIRAFPQTDLCNGFFVASFRRTSTVSIDDSCPPKSSRTSQKDRAPNRPSERFKEHEKKKKRKKRKKSTRRPTNGCKD